VCIRILVKIVTEYHGNCINKFHANKRPLFVTLIKQREENQVFQNKKILKLIAIITKGLFNTP